MESTIYTVAGKTFELQHHGVKGMKWGVRKDRKKSGTTQRTDTVQRTNSAISDEQAAKRRRRGAIAGAIAGGASALTAAVVTTMILRKIGNNSVSQYI